MTTPNWIAVTACLACLSLGACERAESTTVITASELQARFNADCVGCHVGAELGGLNIDDAYAATVGVPSSIGMPLVDPGHHQNSYNWHKLNGTHVAVGGFGTTMPVARPHWSPEDLAAYAAWIDSGAPDD